MVSTINDLATTLANALGLPRKLVNETARYLREAGLLPDGDAPAGPEHWPPCCCGSWRNLGDLKRELLDLWTEERNAYAKKVMLDIEKQRRKAK